MEGRSTRIFRETARTTTARKTAYKIARRCTIPTILEVKTEVLQWPFRLPYSETFNAGLVRDAMRCSSIGICVAMLACRTRCGLPLLTRLSRVSGVPHSAPVSRLSRVSCPACVSCLSRISRLARVSGVAHPAPISGQARVTRLSCVSRLSCLSNLALWPGWSWHRYRR
jgi:hypothetical protein